MDLHVAHLVWENSAGGKFENQSTSDRFRKAGLPSCKAGYIAF